MRAALFCGMMVLTSRVIKIRGTAVKRVYPFVALPSPVMGITSPRYVGRGWKIE